MLEGLFQFVKGDRPLSNGYIHELHAGLLRHQETTVVVDRFGHLFESQLAKGKYKDRPNNPKRPDGTRHQYCPPEQVDSEMERSLMLHEEHEKKGVAVEVEAAWLHHRFTQIHPYQGGNGRVARALASSTFIKAGWFPVVVTRDDRARYIDALEAADEGDLRSLVGFFVNVQKRSLFQATQAAGDTHPVETVTEAIAAAKKVLTGAGTSLDQRIWLKAKRTADLLMELAGERMTQVAEMLRTEIGGNRPEFKFHTLSGTTTPFSPPKLEYTPNTDDYQQVRELSISTHRGRVIEVHAHAIGSRFRGLIAIVAFVWSGSGSELASKEPFQVNYAESFENAERRFRPWLEESLVNALTLWRKSL